MAPQVCVQLRRRSSLLTNTHVYTLWLYLCFARVEFMHETGPTLPCQAPTRTLLTCRKGAWTRTRKFQLDATLTAASVTGLLITHTTHTRYRRRGWKRSRLSWTCTMRCTLSFDEHSMAVVRLPSWQTTSIRTDTLGLERLSIPQHALFAEFCSIQGRSHTHSIVEQTCRHGITLNLSLRTQSHMFFCSTQARFPCCCW
jgi:hypothetical protein